MFQVAIFMGGSFLCFALLYPQQVDLTTAHVKAGREQRPPAGDQAVEKADVSDRKTGAAATACDSIRILDLKGLPEQIVDEIDLGTGHVDQR
jgi:hypothetical protein